MALVAHYDTKLRQMDGNEPSSMGIYMMKLAYENLSILWKVGKD